MKFRFKKRIVSAVLSAALLIGAAGPVLAGGDTMPPREGEQGYLGENQPTYHGHRAYDVLNWSPKTDEYASFMRAEVPLQERNEAYAAAQANPQLDQTVQALALMEDYGNEFFNPTQYNDDFAQYCFNFWQYLDIQASWHGTVTNPTPDSLFDPEAGWWERAYEFGVLNIPNPSYTNAAHKNGVMALGCIFFPRTEHTDDWVFQDEDGRFPMADKLVEIANYYGFDGYFINAEESLPADFMPMYEEFCRAMTQQGLYIQVYASNLYGQNNESSWGRIDYYNKTAANFSNWILEPGEESIAANSLYMNPGPSVDMVDTSVATMEALGLSAKDTVFMTLEAGQTGFSGVRGSLNNTLDENLVPRTGIACLGAGTVWAHLDEQVFGHTGNNSYSENRRGDADYQKYVFARERTWWSGAADQPYYANDNSYIVEGVSFLNKNTTQYTEAERQQLLQAILDATTDPYATANDPTRDEYDGYSSAHGDFQSWPGMAAFISERSVINGSNFYTSFNTGHGMQYFVDGQVSNSNEWSNMNVQDILPTWQWWIETESENRLGMDFDYGKAYNAGYDYIQVGGYEGSSSLAIFGDVDAQSDIRLYKTDLAIGEGSTVELTYNKPSKTDDSQFSFVLYLKDGEDAVKTVYIPVKNANRKTAGWVKTTLDLSAYAGETIAAFGVSVDTKGVAISDYQINLGEIAISDGTLSAPAAPTGLTIDRMFDTGEVYLSWDLADYDQVQKYNVYAVSADGTKTYVGGAYADYYYVKDTMYNANGVVTFQVTAEGADGQESAPAAVSCDTNAANLAVEEAAGVLNATWTTPDVDFTSILAEVTLPDNYYGNTNVFTATFAKGETSGAVAVPVADGSRYILRLSFLDAEGNVVAFQDCSGELLDLYCENYRGGLEARTMSSGWKLINPEVYDWWHLWAWKSSGEPITFGSSAFATRGVTSLVDLPISGDFGFIEVQLEDFAGNLSERTRVYWGVETKAVDETLFPDAALLAAVKEQVGTTMEDILAFDGALDLSNTAVADLTGISFLENMERLNLTNTAVTKVDGLRNLKEINITGCTKLEILDFADSNLEKIICDDTSALTALTSVKLEGARLDLSEGTPEKAFVDAAAKLTEGKEDIILVDPELTNFAKKGTGIDCDADIFDGSTNNYVWGTNGMAFTVDLGAPKTVESWKLINYSARYLFHSFDLLASDDNETYTLVTSVTDITDVNLEATLEEPVTARYFQVLVTADGDNYARDFELIGHELITYPAGVTCGSQRPVAYMELPETVSYENGEGTVELASIPTYTTVRGTDLAALKGADFLAEDYDVDAQMAGFDVIYVGENACTELSLSAAGTYTVFYVKFGQQDTVLDTVVTIGEPVHNCPSEAFEDLDITRWYHKGVDFALDTGLMVGMDKTHFAPDGTLTRGQLVTILYRLAGSPEVTAETPFTDVAEGRFYAKAVAWAYENDIVKGITETTFVPNANATREQLVTFLARYTQFQGIDVDAQGDLSAFVDGDTVSHYAAASVTWAVNNGILVGDEAGRLNPRGYATRAQIATIVMRYCQTFGE